MIGREQGGALPRAPPGAKPLDLVEAGVIALDDGCRGAAAGLLLMVAVVLLRNQSSAAARLGAVLAVAGATYAIIEAPGFPADWRWLGAPAADCQRAGCLLAVGAAAFDDDFVFRPWHGGVGPSWSRCG